MQLTQPLLLLQIRGATQNRPTRFTGCASLLLQIRLLGSVGCRSRHPSLHGMAIVLRPPCIGYGAATIGPILTRPLPDCVRRHGSRSLPAPPSLSNSLCTRCDVTLTATCLGWWELIGCGNRRRSGGPVVVAPPRSRPNRRSRILLNRLLKRRSGNGLVVPAIKWSRGGRSIGVRPWRLGKLLWWRGGRRSKRW